MKTAIAYVRVSTDTQDNGDSQILQIKNYCKGRYNFDETDVLKDTMSGTIADRAGLSRLMSLTTSDCDIVIVSETSRLSRQSDYLHLLNLVQGIQQAGLDVLFLESNKEYKANATLDLVDIITLAAKAQANAEEREKIKERMKRGKAKKLQQSCYVGGKVAYGFKVIPNPKRTSTNDFGKSLYVVDETKVEQINLIFSLIANEGLTLRDTAKHLNRIGETKNGKAWSIGSIYKLVTNTSYKGDYSTRGEKGNIKGIVSPDLWDLAATKRQENQLFKNKGSVNLNILKGIAKCACGFSLYYHAQRANGTAYRCVSKNNYVEGAKCSNYGISQPFLDSVVWSLTKAFVRADDFKIKTDQKRKTISKEIAVKTNEVSILIADEKEIAKEVEGLTNVIAKTTDYNVIPVLTKKLSSLIEEQTAKSKSIAKAQRELSKLTASQEDFINNMLPALVNEVSIEDKNEIFKKYLESVTYYSVTLTTGFIRIVYKNGHETVVLADTKRTDKKAYNLPSILMRSKENIDSLSLAEKTVKIGNKTVNIPNNVTDYTIDKPFALNTTNRTITETLPDGTVIPEKTFKEFVATHDMEQYRIAI